MLAITIHDFKLYKISTVRKPPLKFTSIVEQINDAEYRILNYTQTFTVT